MKPCSSQEDVEKYLTTLLQGPEYPQQDFIYNRVKFADIYVMAVQFYRVFTAQEEPSVPICLAAEERSVMAAAILAALAAKKTLALPHSSSEAALQQMQEVTGYQTAIVDAEQQVNLPPGTRRISYDPNKEESTALPVTTLSTDAELFLLFTGGSTGTPKIWSKTAGNIFGEALFMTDRYHISSTDIIVSTVSPYHIYGLLFSVLIPLVGSARVLAETPSFPAEIVDLVERTSATVLVSVPAHYRVLKGRVIGSSLQQAFSSAGMLEKEDSLDFYACNTIGVVEVYGSTETGGIATRNRAKGEEFFHPLELVRWQIKEERMSLQSPFLSPDLPVNPDGFFLSGDRVQSRGGEEFSLHGRADTITKVAGVRIDLDEVRDLLQEQPGVKECVVVSLSDETGRGSRIAALVRGETVDLGQIKKALRRSLEPAAQPKRIRLVSSIPVTRNGKYDRDAIHDLLSLS